MCTVKLNAETAASFQFAISHHYWYQMYIDELPVSDSRPPIDESHQHSLVAT